MLSVALSPEGATSCKWLVASALGSGLRNIDRPATVPPEHRKRQIPSQNRFIQRAFVT